MMAQEGKITSFVDARKQMKWKRAIHTMSNENTSTHKVSFENNKLRKWTHNQRRVGRPRLNWTEETINELWEIVKKTNSQYRYIPFDENNEDMINIIKHVEVPNENQHPPPPA